MSSLAESRRSYWFSQSWEDIFQAYKFLPMGKGGGETEKGTGGGFLIDQVEIGHLEFGAYVK